MLPSGHIEYTWAVLNLLQRQRGLFRNADYRLVALAATAPDLLDKPLALTLYRDQNAALFWGHNLWLHMGVWAVVCAWALGGRDASAGCASGERAKTRLEAVLPYLLAFSGHLLADRMWGFRESLLYPLGAGHWHPWIHVGNPEAMLGAYVDIVRATPLLMFFELSGLALLGWFFRDRKLWQRARLVHFLRSGRVEATESRQGIAAEGTARGSQALGVVVGWLLQTLVGRPQRLGSGSGRHVSGSGDRSVYGCSDEPCA